MGGGGGSGLGPALYQGIKFAAGTIGAVRARGWAGALRHGARTGGKAALVIGGIVVVVGAAGYVVDRVQERQQREKVLRDVRAEQLPDVAIPGLVDSLTTESPRAVDQSIADLVRLVS